MRNHVSAGWSRRYACSNRSRFRRRRFGRRLLLEQLEDRRVLTAIVWATDSDGFWDEPANWSPPQVPNSSDDVTVDRGAANPTITVRDNREVNSLASNEALVLASGLYDLQSDASVFGLTCCNSFANSGVILKSGGSGLSRIGVPSPNPDNHDFNFNLTGGSIEAQIGTIELNAPRGDSTGGTLNAAANSLIRLAIGGVGGSTASLEGSYTGSGDGRVELASGVLSTTGNGATFNFPDGYFHWTGGVVFGPGTGLINSGFISLSGAADRRLAGRLTNNGTIRHEDGGNLLLDGSSILTIAAGSVYDFAGDGDIGPSGQGAGFNSFVQHEGTLRKSAGTGNTSDISTPVNTTATAVMDGQVGRLKFSGGGLWNSTTINAAASAVVEIAGTPAFTGTFTGSGSGSVELSAGVNPADFGVAGATTNLNFPPGLFHWTGGSVVGGGCGSFVGCNIPLNNLGEVTIDGPNGKSISANTIINTGTIIYAGPGEFTLGNGNTLDNRPGGLFEIRGDLPLPLAGAPNPGRFLNAGRFRKSAGGGESLVESRIDNAATGVIEVDAGRVRFVRGGTSEGIMFDVAAGAGVDLAGDHNNSFFFGNSTYTGSGLGTVVLTGQIQARGSDAPVFDFPPGMFRWSGGSTFWRLINNGEITMDSASGVFSRIHFTNNGTFIHSGSGNYALNPDSIFENNGLYELRSDGDVVVPNSASAGTMQFANSGVLR